MDSEKDSGGVIRGSDRNGVGSDTSEGGVRWASTFTEIGRFHCGGHGVASLIITEKKFLSGNGSGWVSVGSRLPGVGSNGTGLKTLTESAIGYTILGQSK